MQPTGQATLDTATTTAASAALQAKQESLLSQIGRAHV